MENTKLPAVNHTAAIGELTLESGKVLNDVHIAYQRIGAEDAPAIFVCHALTGNHYTLDSEIGEGWWTGLLGSGEYIDLDRYQVITTNVLGGCDGSTGALSINPDTGVPYGPDFPVITIRDMVHAQKKLLDVLRIRRLEAVIGGSLGGMQVLEWGLLYPDYMERLIPIAVTPTLSDYAIGFNAAGRSAIISDPLWNNGRYSPDCGPRKGLGIARMIGMLTYRSGRLFDHRFQRKQTGNWETIQEKAVFSVESYLHYQADKLADRFDANCYLTLLKAMDTHDIGRGRGGVAAASQNYNVPMLCVGFSGDLLYPVDSMQEFILLVQSGNKEARFQEVNTMFGHDGFLTEFDKWGNLFANFMRETIKT
ncbi:homoserine O-acetyltransferase MetX [Fictibacillus terranigra]|uniref:Homoserine O-acetyltransferase n=1 Tax=Fictibacillus terranigra TaxID=3058424 RepID=A0ABT8E5Q0_9BACL|nr:homoserine O-acetyltransferase [Fictibacillus sp. CENA-BCM004]MDN4073209.1 homoserine O-acetyltransferase [Fictibacillus sp. CENA-BCM004]